MRVRKNKKVAGMRLVTLTGIDSVTLRFILVHAKDSLEKDKPKHTIVNYLNKDLIRICDEISQFLEVDKDEIKEVAD